MSIKINDKVNVQLLKSPAASGHGFSECHDFTPQRTVVWVNVYKGLGDIIYFTRGYATREEAARMRVKGRGKSQRYINAMPIRVTI